MFCELPEILDSTYFLVTNNTRVFPARLRAFRPGKTEQIEILLIREINPWTWLTLMKPASKAPQGQEVKIGDLTAHVLETRESGSRVLRFERSTNLMDVFNGMGEPPLPPYIGRRRGQSLADDRLRYQTVYARHIGSIAAPTAGLHFSERTLGLLEAGGIKRCEVLLHVGYGTFQPIRCERIEDHQMESEYYEIDEATAGLIQQYKREGKRLIAIGTTTTRCLEFVAAKGDFEHGSTGLCDLFIYPGFKFHMINGLLTNFHLPRSTLFMLVCAFAGRELAMECYREAVTENYRFFSYGDCMLLL